MVRKYIREEEWRIVENCFDPALHPSSESIFSIGNGKLGQRANFEEAYSGRSLQGSYCAGVYYPDKTKVGWWKNGYPEYFAKVINSCNYIGIDVQVNGDTFDLAKAKLVNSFERVLDMRDASLSRTVDLELANGARLQLKTHRFLSMADDELGLIRYEITALNEAVHIELEPYLDADIHNEDSNYGEQFWTVLNRAVSSDAGLITTRTKKLDFQLAFAFRSKIWVDGQLLAQPVDLNQDDWRVGQRYALSLQTGQTVRLEKYCAVISSRDHPYDQLAQIALDRSLAAMCQGYDALLADHQQIWTDKWQHMDIKIEGDLAAQQAIRFNILQLNQTYTGRDARLNIGPKGFTGEKYGGSTYWDTEAYCLPFYLATAKSQVAKQLLLYRYRHLERAQENAAKLGFKDGAALYPMVTMNGEECHNEWEITFEEIHRNGAIAYAIYNYISYTGDENYLAEAGLEVLVGIARFWAQRVNWSEAKGKYVILGVTGPNEYENNVNNNWYTNYIASWCLRYTESCLQRIAKIDPKSYLVIQEKLHLGEGERSAWARIERDMYYPVDEQRDIFLQQEGYLDKVLLDASELDPAERPINQHWSWDRILRSCFIKQADTLQGFYFFEDDFNMDQQRRHFEFYEPKTVHESSLSPCVHVVLACKIGEFDKAYELYLRTSRLDLDDYNHEVHEGLHITSMAGTWMSVVQGFGGMRVKNGHLTFSPALPQAWQSLQFVIQFRERSLRIEVKHDEMYVEQLEGEPLAIKLFEQTVELSAGEPIRHKIK